MSTLTLTWIDDNQNWRKIGVKELAANNREFFIGRLHRKDREIFQRNERTIVFFFNPWSRKIEDTNVSALPVSERHLLVKTIPTQNILLIKDHGRSGNGTTYGTIVDSQELKPGTTTTAKPGQTILLAGTFELKIAQTNPQGEVYEQIKLGIPSTIDKALETQLKKKGYIVNRPGENNPQQPALLLGETGTTINLPGRKVEIIKPRFQEIIKTIIITVQDAQQKLKYYQENALTETLLYETLGRLQAAIEALINLLKTHETAQQAKQIHIIINTITQRGPEKHTLQILTNRLALLKGKLNTLTTL